MTNPFAWTKHVTLKCYRGTKLHLIRRMCSTLDRRIVEFKMPVPWGHIAGKEWGDANGEPWIALHGWLDNCGSFDRLLPFFPKNHRVICLDIPGHGFSSHYPPGMMYHHFDGISHIRRAADFYKLTDFNLLGHSMGASMCMLFAATHPEMVRRLIMIDSYKPMSRQPCNVVDMTRLSVDQQFRTEDKLEKNKVSYDTYEEIYERLRKGVNEFLDEVDTIPTNAVDALAVRGITETSDGKFIFTRDLKQRVASLYGYPTEVIKEFAQKIKCPHLIIKATRHPERWKVEAEDVDIIRNTYMDSNFENFREETVDGNHAIHLTNPENVYSAIEKFLGTEKHKL